MIFDLISLLLFTITVAYCILIAVYLFNIKKADHPLVYDPGIKFSIIIAARNEEDNLESLFRSISRLKYPSTSFEVIIIDDHSSDRTFHMAKKLVSDYLFTNFTILKADPLSVLRSPKKAALLKGIQSSKYDYIITTDADCRVSENWLAGFSAALKKEDHDLIAAPVLLTGELFIQKLQSLEMIALMAVTEASFNMGKPFLCNGANLLLKKQTFFDLNGYSGSEHLASGDDIFILYKMKSACKRMMFLNNEGSLVFTSGVKSINDLINQRIRWASKWSAGKDHLSLINSILVFMLGLLLVVSLVLSPFSKSLAILIGCCWTLKSIFDFLILFLTSGNYNSRTLLKYFIILQLIYPFYTLVIGMTANMKNYQWKERSFK